MLIAGRAIQGVGGAVFPLAFGIIRDEFPPEKVATAIGHQRQAIAEISQSTNRASTSAAQVSSNLQALHATFADVGTAAGDIRSKIGALGESAQALKSETEHFLRDVLAA